MRCAIDHGTTKEELFEAMKAAAVPGGDVACSVGGRALQALEQDRMLRSPPCDGSVIHVMLFSTTSDKRC
jgi:hypothetical protein